MPGRLARTLTNALVLLLGISSPRLGAGPAAQAGSPPPVSPRAEADPLERVLSERLGGRAAQSLPLDRSARLRLEVLEITPGSGTRTVGRFSAPVVPSRAALLEHPIQLPGTRRAPPAALGLEVRILPRVLNEARIRFEVESRVRVLGEPGSAFVRRTEEELEEGRSALLDAFQVPGSSRRVVLALSWQSVPLEPVAEAVGPHISPMVDLLVELVRVEKEGESTLRRQRLSAGVGSEVRSLMRLVERPSGTVESQDLELQLAPRTLDWRGLLLAIRVKGSLLADEAGDPLWIDHQDSLRLGPGGVYSVELPGDGEASYRLDIRPYY